MKDEPATDIACPECGAKVSISVDDLAKKETQTCPRGHTFRPSGQATTVARRVQKSRDDMLKNIREPDK